MADSPRPKIEAYLLTKDAPVALSSGPSSNAVFLDNWKAQEHAVKHGQQIVPLIRVEEYDKLLEQLAVLRSKLDEAYWRLENDRNP